MNKAENEELFGDFGNKDDFGGNNTRGYNHGNWIDYGNSVKESLNADIPN